MGGPGEITEILQRVRRGEHSAAAALLPVVYDELRRLAGSYFQSQNADHTLEPTALVHEAYAKLAGAADDEWANRAHFFGVAAKAMRQVLTDHARRKKAAKRGGGYDRVTLSGLITPPDGVSQIDLIALDEALEKLSARYPQQARVVELRFLAGLPLEEAARVLGVSASTVERKWLMARAWLRRELSGETRR